MVVPKTHWNNILGRGSRRLWFLISKTTSACCCHPGKWGSAVLYFTDEARELNDWSTQLLYIRWELNLPSPSLGTSRKSKHCIKQKAMIIVCLSKGLGQGTCSKGNLFSSGDGTWTFAHAKQVFCTPRPLSMWDSVSLWSSSWPSICSVFDCWVLGLQAWATRLD